MQRFRLFFGGDERALDEELVFALGVQRGVLLHRLEHH